MKTPDAKPYVYKCTHKTTGQFYYGYRSQNTVCAKEDLGGKYKTSSKIVRASFEDFACKIVAECVDKATAYLLEQQLIYEHKTNPLILNRKCYYHCKGINQYINYRHTEETKQKIGVKSKGRKSALKGIARPQQVKDQISATLKEKIKLGNCGNRPLTMSSDRRAQLSEIRLNWWKTAPLITCPHCLKVSKNKGSMNRHHFDNCKLK